MDKIVTQVACGLDAYGIAYRIEGEALRVPLPEKFGELDIAALDGGDSIVELVDGDWHSHGNLLMYYGGKTQAEAIVLFVTKIFKGQILLIEEREPGKKIRRTVEDDLDAYLKLLPMDTQYKVFNKK